MGRRSDTRYEGRLVSWNADRGFGFIQPRNADHQVFVHVTDFRDRSRRPVKGDRLDFTITRDDKGRPRAKHVNTLKAAGRLPGSGYRVPTRYLLTVAFALLLLAGWSVNRIPVGLALAYTVMSILTFSLYALDKAAARGGGRRTPESSLHLLALTGGWPGALVAQQRLRHKTRKQPFGAIFWATVVVNIAVLTAMVIPGTFNWLGQLDGLLS